MPVMSGRASNPSAFSYMSFETLLGKLATQMIHVILRDGEYPASDTIISPTGGSGTSIQVWRTNDAHEAPSVLMALINAIFIFRWARLWRIQHRRVFFELCSSPVFRKPFPTHSPPLHLWIHGQQSLPLAQRYGRSTQHDGNTETC